LGQSYTIPRSSTRPNDPRFDNGRPSSSSFEQTKNDLNFKKPSQLEKSNLQNWEKLYEVFDVKVTETFESQGDTDSDEDADNGSLTFESNFETVDNTLMIDDTEGSFSRQQKDPYQIHHSYIVSQIKSGFLLIDQQAASERILFEKYLTLLDEKQVSTQTQLFPKTLHFSPSDAYILKEILPEINRLGFDVQEFGSETFIVHGLPSDWKQGKDEQKIIESLLEQYKIEIDFQLDISERIARSLARSAAVKKNTPLSIREMHEVIDQLFACAMPFKSPTGRNCFISFDLEDLQKQFLQ
jgi:DNA mismatch repair protein MutL